MTFGEERLLGYSIKNYSWAPAGSVKEGHLTPPWLGKFSYFDHTNAKVLGFWSTQTAKFFDFDPPWTIKITFDPPLKKFCGRPWVQRINLNAMFYYVFVINRYVLIPRLIWHLISLCTSSPSETGFFCLKFTDWSSQNLPHLTMRQYTMYPATVATVSNVLYPLPLQGYKTVS